MPHPGAHADLPRPQPRRAGAGPRRRVRLPFVAGVAVYTDERSAEVLLRFPGLGLDPERVARVLAAPGRVRGGGARSEGGARGGRGEPVRSRRGTGRTGGRGDQRPRSARRSNDRRDGNRVRRRRGVDAGGGAAVGRGLRPACGLPRQRQPRCARLAGARVPGPPAARRTASSAAYRGLRRAPVRDAAAAGRSHAGRLPHGARVFGLVTVVGAGEALPIAPSAFQGRLVHRRALHDAAATRAPRGTASGAGRRRRPRPAGVRTARRAAARCARGPTFPPRPSSTGSSATRGSSSWTGFRTMSCRPRRAHGASGPIACS